MKYILLVFALPIFSLSAQTVSQYVYGHLQVSYVADRIEAQFVTAKETNVYRYAARGSSRKTNNRNGWQAVDLGPYPDLTHALRLIQILEGEGWEIIDVNMSAQPEVVSENYTVAEKLYYDYALRKPVASLVQSSTNAERILKSVQIEDLTNQTFRFSIAEEYETSGERNRKLIVQKKLAWGWVDLFENDLAVQPFPASEESPDPFIDLRVEGEQLVIQHTLTGDTTINYNHYFTSNGTNYLLTKVAVDRSFDNRNCTFFEQLVFAPKAGHVSGKVFYKPCEDPGLSGATKLISSYANKKITIDLENFVFNENTFYYKNPSRIMIAY